MGLEELETQLRWGCHPWQQCMASACGGSRAETSEKAYSGSLVSYDPPSRSCGITSAALYYLTLPRFKGREHKAPVSMDIVHRICSP